MKCECQSPEHGRKGCQQLADPHAEPDVAGDMICATCYEQCYEAIELPVVNDGPPYDAATASGMYDHDDYN